MVDRSLRLSLLITCWKQKLYLKKQLEKGNTLFNLFFYFLIWHFVCKSSFFLVLQSPRGSYNQLIYYLRLSLNII